MGEIVTLHVNEVCVNCANAPLIILQKTGIVYMRQCGINLCMQEEAEGFVIMVSPNYLVINNDRLDVHWQGDGFRELQMSVAQEIDEAFIKLNETSKYNPIRIDFSRVYELLPGWWPVLYGFTQNEDRTYDTRKGILCGY